MVVLNLPDTVALVQQSDPDRLIETVVDHWEVGLRGRLADPLPRPLGLATGRTMEPFYAALVRRLRHWGPADLKLLRQGWLSFNLDEYVGLPARHGASFRAYMDERLGEPLGLTSAQLCLPDGAAADPVQEARRYGQQLRQAGGIGVQLLGLGSNGHVGFNEPPAALMPLVVALISRRRRVIKTLRPSVVTLRWCPARPSPWAWLKSLQRRRCI